MSHLTQQWTRDHWQAGGSDATVFYYIVGASSQPIIKLNADHGIGAIPPELEVTVHTLDKGSHYFDIFQPPMGLQIERVFGATAPSVRNAKTITVMKGTFKDPQSLEYLRAAGIMASAIAENSAVAVFDLLGTRWFTPEKWRSIYAINSKFNFSNHVSVVATNDARFHPGIWMHTRGMKKFGRPEIQVRHIPAADNVRSQSLDAAYNVISSIGEQLALGATLSDGAKIHLPGYKTKISIIAYPDDSHSDGHFLNASLQIVDYDEATGKRSTDLTKYLTEAITK
jgi:hypothetical protein